MRLGNLLFSAIHLFVVFFIFILGVMSLLVPFSPGLRFSMTYLLAEQSSIFLWIGSFSVSLGTLFFIGLWRLNKKRYLQIKMQHNQTIIEEAIIKEYVQSYWKEMFPSIEPAFDIVIHPHQKLELITQNFPSLEEEQKESLFERVQSELGVLLARHLGYEKDFFLTISEK